MTSRLGKRLIVLNKPWESGIFAISLQYSTSEMIMIIDNLAGMSVWCLLWSLAIGSTSCIPVGGSINQKFNNDANSSLKNKQTLNCLS